MSHYYIDNNSSNRNKPNAESNDNRYLHPDHWRRNAPSQKATQHHNNADGSYHRNRDFQYSQREDRNVYQETRQNHREYNTRDRSHPEYHSEKTFRSDGLVFRETRWGECEVIGMAAAAGAKTVIVPEKTHYRGLRVTSIGKGAFKNGEMIKVILPNSIERLQSSCFFECAVLRELHCESTCISWIANDSFLGCPNLQVLIASAKFLILGETALAASIERFATTDRYGVVSFNGLMTAFDPSNVRDYFRMYLDIPAEVKAIGKKAFSRASSEQLIKVFLTSVEAINTAGLRKSDGTVPMLYVCGEKRQWVESFHKRNPKHPPKYISIHCTDGVIEDCV